MKERTGSTQMLNLVYTISWKKKEEKNTTLV